MKRFYITIIADEDAGEAVTRLDSIVDMNSYPDAMSKEERADGGNNKKRKSQTLQV